MDSWLLSSRFSRLILTAAACGSGTAAAKSLYPSKAGTETHSGWHSFRVWARRMLTIPIRTRAQWITFKYLRRTQAQRRVSSHPHSKPTYQIDSLAPQFNPLQRRGTEELADSTSHADHGMFVVGAAPKARARECTGWRCGARLDAGWWAEAPDFACISVGGSDRRQCGHVGAGERAGLPLEHRKDNPRAWKERQSESFAQQPARPYTIVNSVRHTLATAEGVENINGPGNVRRWRVLLVRW
ncbi:hypothetical protein B0H13DRAFT_1887768 [Mycena leptocephala]|nr:hypothetical protein B0H13DRAFT_1887768 [Mycena leptocephala]